MRVGINGFFWKEETTGSGQYTRCLVRELMALKTEYTLFLSREAKPGTEDPHHRFIATPFSKNENLAKLWFEQVSFPRACRGMDLAHVPYFAPPLYPSIPTVVTIHDLIPLILPAYKGSILVRFYTSLVSIAAKRAAAIITDSDSSKRDILRLLEIPPERVHTILLAADERFKAGAKTELDQVRRKYSLPQEFILYLGGFDQRKNMNTLFKGFKGLKERLGDKCPLVIAGALPGKDTLFFPHPRRLAEEAGVSDAVCFIGWVPEEEKPALYSLATLFLYPSLYEGFGLPPLEAMASGTPVIASNAASLPEVVGDGGVLVDPQDPAAWAEPMVALLTSPQKREELSAKAVKQAQKFSWRKTAKETLEVYKQVVAKR